MLEIAKKICRVFAENMRKVAEYKYIVLARK